ncbi:MAG TPA: SEC-C metal-binding domain-containing protein [Trueperaceae bacterium]
MASHKIGRNEPCPCGSGKKYKKCCLGKEIEPVPNRAREFNEEIAHIMDGREFQSIDEAQELLDRLTEMRNHAPLEDFQGLSPEQMMRMLHFPFESPEVLSFGEVLDHEVEAPILELVRVILEAVGEDGLKATAKGNLPRALCREAAERWTNTVEYRWWKEPGDIRKEEDFPELNAARITAELAGLLRRQKGKFYLTQRCKRSLAESGYREIYPLLLRSYATEFNWAYRDNYPDGLDLIQQSFAFTLYLLARRGSSARSNGDYESWFQRAYPDLLHQVDANYSYRSAEELVADCYTLRALVRFAHFLGLARVEPVSDSQFEREYLVEKLPLLDECVRFEPWTLRAASLDA